MTLLDMGVTLHQFKLANGFRVVHFERPGMPMYMRAAFDAGYRFDPVGKEGLAHFVEHMIVAGTEKYASKTELATFIESLGGVMGASTGPEHINVNVAVSDPNDIDAGLEIFGEMLLRARYDPGVFETERESVRGEIGNKRANPSSYLKALWAELFFQGTTIGRWGVGIESGIDACSVEESIRYHKDMLSADRGVLVTSGGLGINELKPLVAKHLDGLPAASPAPHSSLVKVSRQEPIMIARKDNSQIYLSYGFRTVSLDHSDNLALAILRVILGGGRASSLSRVLRHERGLVYSINAFRSSYTGGGVWSVETTADKNKIQAVVDGIGEEFLRVFEGKIMPEELNFAQRKITKSVRMELQTSESWVNRHSDQILYGGKYNDITKYLEDIEAVSMEDLQRVGKAYFRPDAWYFGAVGDLSKSDIQVGF